jgi:GT2 family glycosyltransferase/glycosyltransferase involved in cell wall biosynthesis
MTDRDNEPSGNAGPGYAAMLECSGSVLVGWAYDRAEPERELAFDVEVDGVVVGVARTGLERSDVADAGHPTRRAGFRFALPPALRAVGPRRVSLRIAGTGHDPFGTCLSGVDVAAYAAALLRGPGAERDALMDGVMRPALLEALRGGGDGALSVSLPRGLVQLSRPGCRRESAPIVDIVIPVYRGLDETLACIESVLVGGGAIGFRVVVVDDCGPEPELRAALAGLAAAGRIHLLVNEHNLGFVASVNRGMLASAVNDVVLLNSDTLVPAGWLDRLYGAAHGDERIGTATALSNNATIFSLPGMGGGAGLPYGSDLAGVAAACARANAGRVVDVPTAHGFCMFIKRAALDEVGLFDVATFGRGYGEENDFSQRAAAHGWRNVAACDVFVQHLGSVSFGDAALGLTERNLRLLSRRYPDYHAQVMDFIGRDPLFAARNAVQREFWRGRAVVVLVSLAIGGGVSHHVTDAAAGLLARGMLPLLLTRDGAGGYRVAVAAGEAAGALVYPPGEDALAQAFSDIVDLSPAWLHVHHLLDLEDAAADLIRLSGVPYQVTLHDFFHVCPRVTLLDEAARYCGLPAADACDRCVARGGAHPALHASLSALSRQVGRWRAHWGRFLEGAAAVHAPSGATAALHARAFPALSIAVRPHETAEEIAAPAWPAAAPDIGVAVIGAIGPHKGLARLLDLLRHAERWAPEMRFVLVGHASDAAALGGFGNVTVTGPYPAEEVGAAIAAANCRVALFLSPWPETYSYTLSEALAAGLTPVAPDLGAFGERLTELGHGVLVEAEPAPAELVDAIRTAALQVPRRRFAFVPTPAAETAPAGGPVSRVRPLGAPAGVHPDGWLARQARWRLHLTEPAQRLSIDLFVPETMPGQHVTVRCGDLRVRRLLPAGQRTSVVLNLDGNGGFLAVALAFAFDAPIDGAAPRLGGGVLEQVVIDSASGRISWRVGAPRVVPAVPPATALS